VGAELGIFGGWVLRNFWEARVRGVLHHGLRVHLRSGGACWLRISSTRRYGFGSRLTEKLGLFLVSSSTRLTPGTVCPILIRLSKASSTASLLLVSSLASAVSCRST